MLQVIMFVHVRKNSKFSKILIFDEVWNDFFVFAEIERCLHFILRWFHLILS